MRTLGPREIRRRVLPRRTAARTQRRADVFQLKIALPRVLEFWIGEDRIAILSRARLVSGEAVVGCRVTVEFLIG